jgi:hypothetical protein
MSSAVIPGVPVVPGVPVRSFADYPQEGRNDVPEINSVNAKANAALATAIPAAAVAGLDWLKNNGLGLGGGRHDDLYRENVRQADIIARLEAEKYADAKVERLADKMECKIERLEARIDGVKDGLTSLRGAVELEAVVRKADDEALRCFIVGNYLPAKKHIDADDVMRKGSGCGERRNILQDLITDGSLTGTLTIGAATSE